MQALLHNDLTHQEYVAFQTLHRMGDYEIEQVDTIVTALMNLGIEASAARIQGLQCYCTAIEGRLSEMERELKTL